MLNWEGMDPHRVERAVHMLLRRLYPDVESLDGSGGDGGKDAQRVTADGRTVFEIKSFCGRLNASRRRQIERSLRAAVDSTPDLTCWVLIVPVNRTATRPSSRSSEEAWFAEKLSPMAHGVKLEWWGRDWLDEQFAANRDLRRYVEGEMAELLQLAGEHQLEQAALVNGGSDLAARNRALRRVVDESSPHWTLDWRMEGGTCTRILRAKTADAAELDPIVMKPTFRFDPDDAEAVNLRERFFDAMHFGGSVRLPESVIADFRLEASSEVRRLLGDIEGAGGTLEFHSQVQDLDKPIRGLLQVLDRPSGKPVAAVEIFMRQRTAGSKGATLIGGDAGRALTMSLSLPRPNSWEVAQLVTGGTLNVDVDDLAGHDLATALPILELQVAATPGRCFRVKLPGLAPEAPAFSESVYPGREPFLDAGRALARLEELLDLPLRMPRTFNTTELEMVRAAVLSLEGERAEIPYDTFPVSVIGDKIEEFLGQLPGETIAMRTSNEAYELRLGDLTIPYGPCVMYAPAMRLQNRDELEQHHRAENPVARFCTVDEPIYLLPRALAEEVCAADRERGG